MTQYFLGVDTGSTKSHALIADGSGQALGFGEAGPGNWEGVGWEGMQQVLDTVIEQATTMAGIERSQIAAAGFGLAGFDWPEDRPPHTAIIRAIGIESPLEIVNDALIGLLAGAPQGWGVAVVAGTSCNCYGRNEQGQIGRVGGSSSLFGEYAGSMELVRHALYAIARAWAHRGPETELSGAFVAEIGATDVTDLLAGLDRRRYRLSAQLARTVFDVATAGDDVAIGLIRWAGESLGDLANGVIRQLRLEGLSLHVILTGSMYNGGPLLIEPMRRTVLAVAPRARLVRLKAPPVVGGVILALSQTGRATAPLFPALVESTGALLATSTAASDAANSSATAEKEA